MSFLHYIAYFLFLFSYVSAQSIEGYWVSYDSSSNQPSSVIEIKPAEDGTLYGVVVAGFQHGPSHPDEYCKKCSASTYTGVYGIRKGERVLGKSVMWGFSESKVQSKWQGGNIIRVMTGTLYPASLYLEGEKNDTLRVKVHAGFFSKSVYWKRISESRLSDLCSKIDVLHENGKTYATTCAEVK